MQVPTIKLFFSEESEDKEKEEKVIFHYKLFNYINEIVKSVHWKNRSQNSILKVHYEFHLNKKQVTPLNFLGIGY